VRFRVTSITSGPCGAAIGPVTVRLEDWLNAALGDADFGNGLQQLTFMVVAVDEDTSENERWAKGHNKLGSFRDPVTGESPRHLSLALPLAPSHAEQTEFSRLLRELSQAAIAKLMSRPKRLPRNFDFGRCTAAVRTSLGVYVERAA
jgi:hypothetical protein